MKVLNLIISDNSSDMYIKLKEQWRRYMNAHSDVTSYFLECDSKCQEVYKRDDTIYAPTEECLVPGIFIKTQKGILFGIQEYKGYDYGFSDQDFLDAIDQAWGFHVTQSITEFIQNRYSSANSQVLPFLTIQNPCTSGLTEWISPQTTKAIKAFDMLGREIPLDAKNCLKVITYENGSTKQVYEME
jgi:hypothetical protein